MGDFGYPVAGAIVGFLIGMTGVGGGSLMTPILILLCGINPKAAVGTDLIYAALTKSFGTCLHRMRGDIHWPVVLWMMGGSLPGVACAMTLLHFIHSPMLVAHITRYVLGLCLLATAPAIFFRPILRAWVTRHHVHHKGYANLLTLVLGFVLGCTVTLSSVGAGAIGMAVLVMLYPNLSLKELVAIDIAHAIPLTLIAGLTHWVAGDVIISTLILLLCGSFPGIWLGTYCADYFKETWQRLILGGLLLFLGIKIMMH